MLTPLHVRDVCYAGYTGQTCKYIDNVVRSDGKYVSVCTKLNAGAFAQLQAKTKGYYSPPTGDNCAGYTTLQYKSQGYDVDKP